MLKNYIIILNKKRKLEKMDLEKVVGIVGAGPNVSGLKQFFQGDGIYVLSVICALIIAKNWKEAN
ncbi:hypothetical protein IUSA1_11665, partial [Streptococcus iniae IUSA1]